VIKQNQCTAKDVYNHTTFNINNCGRDGKYGGTVKLNRYIAGT
jgi:hypothetical protein